jgi:hypothetical protein
VAHDGAGAITLWIGKGSVVFTDEAPISSRTRRDAKALFDERTSEAFGSALRDLANAGAGYIPDLRLPGMVLQDLLFPTGRQLAPANYTTPMIEFVRDFDPERTPPSEFEQEFGAQYYEFERADKKQGADGTR